MGYEYREEQLRKHGTRRFRLYYPEYDRDVSNGSCSYGIDNLDTWKARAIRHLGTTGKPCSCWMCGNPRKYYGRKTRKELLSEFDYNQQMEECDGY